MLFVVTDAYRPAPQSAVHAFCHVLPNLWHQMSVIAERRQLFAVVLPSDRHHGGGAAGGDCRAKRGG
ncbi:hypothetical protein ACHWUR_02860 [Klebsiella pneumoniae]